MIIVKTKVVLEFVRKSFYEHFDRMRVCDSKNIKCFFLESAVFIFVTLIIFRKIRNRRTAGLGRTRVVIPQRIVDSSMKVLYVSAASK